MTKKNKRTLYDKVKDIDRSKYPGYMKDYDKYVEELERKRIILCGAVLVLALLLAIALVYIFV